MNKTTFKIYKGVTVLYAIIGLCFGFASVAEPAYLGFSISTWALSIMFLLIVIDEKNGGATIW